MAVGAGAFPFPHIKYGTDECLETLLWSQGPTAEWQVFCHSEREDKKNNPFFNTQSGRCTVYVYYRDITQKRIYM